MNPVLKRCFYAHGNDMDVEFMSRLAGLNEDESYMLASFHRQEPDEKIRQELCMDMDTFKKLEVQFERKMTVAVLRCIQFSEENMRI